MHQRIKSMEIIVFPNIVMVRGSVGGGGQF